MGHIGQGLATLAQLNKYLAAKEEKLANANDLSSMATEFTSNLSRSIEASLQDKRKWIDKAVAAISDREDELECKELALRQLQASIHAQEHSRIGRLSTSASSHLHHGQSKKEALVEQKEHHIAAELTESQ